MDRTNWLYQPWNTLGWLIALVLLAAPACEQRDALEREPRVTALSSTAESESSQSEAATLKQKDGLEVEMKPEDDQVEAANPYPSAYVDAMLERTFGDQARHTEDELKVIRFVNKYVDENGIQVSKPCMFLIRTGNSVW